MRFYLFLHKPLGIIIAILCNMKALLLILSLCCISYSVTAQTKTVYLIRHGKSSHDNSSLTDPERPLADRGHTDSEKVARRIKNRMEKPDVFISSSAIRARQTSEYFCNELEFDYDSVKWSNSLYRCTPSVLLNALASLDEAHQSVMVVAHNPAISSCAAYLQTDTTIRDMPTAAVMAIEFNVDTWKEVPKSKGKMLFFDYPKRKVNN